MSTTKKKDIGQLPLRATTIRVLKKNGINTVEKLLNTKKESLFGMWNFGSKKYEDVVGVLNKKGLKGRVNAPGEPKKTRNKEIFVEGLDIREPTLRHLKNAGYDTAEQVAKAGEEKLLSIDLFGRRKFDEVKSALEKKGFNVPTKPKRGPGRPPKKKHKKSASQRNALLKKSVVDLELPDTLKKRLTSNGYQTLGDIIFCNLNEMQKLKGFGPKKVRRIEDLLIEYGFDPRNNGGRRRVFLDESVDVLFLSDKVKENLKSSGFSTIRDITLAFPDDLLEVRNFGKRALRKVRAQLRRKGYRLQKQKENSFSFD